MLGRIVTVDRVSLGGQLTEAVTASTTLTLDTVTDFAHAGGTLSIAGATRTYTTVDGDAQTVTLTAPVTYPAGLMVTLDPDVAETIARVQLDGLDLMAGTVEALPVLVPYSIRGLLPEGVRPAGSGETVRVAEEGGRLTIRDVLYTEPDIVTQDAIQTVIDDVAAFKTAVSRVVETSTGRPPTLTGNGTTSITWPTITVTYYGETKTLPGGTTTKRYVTWTPGAVTAADSDTRPTTQVVLFINNHGLPTDVQNGDLIDGSLIVNGTLTASALETDLVLTTKLIGGNPTGTRAELTPTGLGLWQDGPDGVTKAGSLSSGGSDFLQVSNATGAIVASIDATGGIVTSTATLGTKPGDTSINGRLFEEHFHPFPLGAIAYGSRQTNGTAVLGSGNIAKWLEVQTVLEPNRLYRVALTPTYTASATAGARCVLALFYASGGAAAVTTSGQLNSARHAMPIAGEAFTSANLSKVFDTTSLSVRTEYRFLTAYYGEGAAAYPIANSSLPSILTIEDLGPAIPDIGIDFSAAPPPSGTKQTYTTYWQASTSATYQGSGAMRYDTDDLVHGLDPSGYNGNGSAVAIFGAGAYYSTNPSEVGKSITTALTGATIIGADVAMKCSHAYYGTGALIYYNTETKTVLPSTFTSPTYYGSSTFAIGQFKYVPVIKAARTSLALGAPAANSLNSYARVNSHTQSAPPVIRYIYTR